MSKKLKIKTIDSRFLLDLVHTAAEIFPQIWSANCCLNATRVLIDVLKLYGHKAEPLAVGALAMNKTWFDFLTGHEGRPITPGLSQRWADQGGHSVAIDEGANQANEWAGHVVLTVGHFMIDGSSGQFSRPEKGISVPVVSIFPGGPAFRAGETAHSECSDGSHIFYFAKPEERGYLLLSGFSRHEDNMDVTRTLVDALREKGHPPKGEILN